MLQHRDQVIRAYASFIQDVCGDTASAAKLTEAANVVSIALATKAVSASLDSLPCRSLTA
jgi:hypothetical protein